MKNIRLKVLRTCIMTALRTCIIFINKEYYYPMKWLLHFLEGGGEPLEVPEELVVQAKEAFNKAIYWNNYKVKEDYFCGKYCVNSSTLYEGSGFYNRPTLFYLLGGFSFNVYPCKEDNKYVYMVSGKDYYDWHSTDNGKYYTSPLGNNPIMAVLIKVLGLIFGNDLFVANGWPMGQAGISNKLWEEMYKVGARSFYSYFSNIPMFTMSERDVAVKNRDKEYDGYYYYNYHIPSYKEIYNHIKECNPNKNVMLELHLIKKDKFNSIYCETVEWSQNNEEFKETTCYLNDDEVVYSFKEVLSE